MLKNITHPLVIISIVMSFVLFVFLYLLPESEKKDKKYFLVKAESYLKHNWEYEYTIDKINSNSNRVVFYSKGKEYYIEKDKENRNFQIVIR